jgi:hypothetical protein
MINMFSLWMVGTIRREVVWLGEVCRVLGGLAGLERGCQLPGLCARIWRRARGDAFSSRVWTFPRQALQAHFSDWWVFLLVFGIKFRRELPEGFKRAFGVGMIPIHCDQFVPSGFLGFARFIDNAASRWFGNLARRWTLAGLNIYDVRAIAYSGVLSVVWRVLQGSVAGHSWWRRRTKWCGTSNGRSQLSSQQIAQARQQLV